MNGPRDDLGWQVLELCQSVFQLESPTPVSTYIAFKEHCISSWSFFGMVLTSTTVGSAAESSEPVAASDVAMSATTSGGAEHGLGRPQQRLSPTMTVNSSNEDATRQRQAKPMVPTSVAIEHSADRMTIAGVDISRNSSIAVLKAAYHFVEVSQSGSKAKLWDRIVSAVAIG